MSIDTRSLGRLAKSLRELPRGLAIAIAERAAPVISELAQASFDGSRDPYGVPWAPSADGRKVTLEESGDLRKYVRYVSNGLPRLRVSLGTPYAKYQIGKRPVYPRQGEALPAEYAETLSKIVAEEVANSMLRGGT